jgi:hypothetical protein
MKRSLPSFPAPNLKFLRTLDIDSSESIPYNLSALSVVMEQKQPELEFLNNLWGLGTE